jgi:hypothetical protein
MGMHTMSSLHFTGYHGTKKQCAVCILRDARFEPSKSSREWLGKGIYFFKEDVLQAFTFARYYHRSKAVSVLKTDIITENYLDTTITKHRNAIYELLDEVLEALKSKEGEFYSVILSYFPELEKGLIADSSEGYILDIMYLIEPYDLVICPYEIPKQEKKQDFRFKPTHLQVCVKNDKCINYSSLEEVEENEYRSI